MLAHKTWVELELLDQENSIKPVGGWGVCPMFLYAHPIRGREFNGHIFTEKQET